VSRYGGFGSCLHVVAEATGGTRGPWHAQAVARDSVEAGSRFEPAHADEELGGLLDFVERVGGEGIRLEGGSHEVGGVGKRAAGVVGNFASGFEGGLGGFDEALGSDLIVLVIHGGPPFCRNAARSGIR
jgi:hypothetical protein